MGWQLRVASNAAASTWTDLTAAVDRTSIRITGQGFDGQIGQGGFDYADDSGAGSIPGFRVYQFKSAPAGIVLERGRIGMKDLARGTRHSGDAHQKDVTLWDCNADLSRIGVHAWVRPSETGRARVLACVADFLAGSPRASTDIATTLVRNANTRTMPAKTYDNTNPFEVISDCADHEAKIFFVTVDDAGDMDLFYDISSYTGYASGLSITDDTPNLTTEFPPIDARSTEDPSELFSHVRATYGSGSASVTATNSAVATAHDYMGTIYHDSGAVASTAQDLVDRFLDVHDQEEVSRRCAIRIPEASIDDIRRGHTISYRAAGTGDLTPVTRRIAQLTWEPPLVEGGDWTAILELDWPLKTGQRYTRPKPPPAGGGGAPEPNPIIMLETCSRSVADWGTSDAGYAWDSTAGAGSTAEVDGTTCKIALGQEDTGSFYSQTLTGLDLAGLTSPIQMLFIFDGLVPTTAFTVDDRFNVSFSVVPAAVSLGIPEMDDQTVWEAFYGTDSTITWDPDMDVLAPFAIRVQLSAAFLRVRVWNHESQAEPTLWDINLAPGTVNEELGELAILTESHSGESVAWELQLDSIDVTGVPDLAVTATSGDWIGPRLIAIGDGSDTAFAVGTAIDSGALYVWVAGILQVPLSVNNAAGTFVLSIAPPVDAEVAARWRVA